MKPVLNLNISAFYSIVAILFFAAISTNAATFTVTNNADSGAGSLRQAIISANSTSGADTVNFAGSLTGLTIVLTTETLQITDALTITGLGANLLTVSRSNAGGIFYVNNQTVSISGLTLTGGTGSAQDGTTDGGAIYTDGGTLNLTSMQFSGNNTRGSGTTENGNGGALYLFGGSNHTISNSTFSNNSAESCGGFDNDGGSLTITNTTVAGNTATGALGFGFGGGLCSGGSTTARNLTVTNNLSAISGGGVTVFDGSFSLQNSIFAGNAATMSFPEIELFSGTFTSAGNNFVGDSAGDSAATSSPITYLPSDIRDTNPQLAPLGFYGGQTRTVLLLSNSTAVNAGTTNNAPTTDERGASRVGNVDIGAFELNNTQNNGANAFVAALPAARTSTNYNQVIIPNNNTNGTPFTYTVTAGSLPPGVTLTFANGVYSLTGTPTQSGNYNFTLTASNGSVTTTNNYSLTVPASTAASVSIGGRVLTNRGGGLVNALVTLTDSNGLSRSVRTSLNGRFSFTGIASGTNQMLSVQSKRYRFDSQNLSVTDNTNNIVFTAQ